MNIDLYSILRDISKYIVVILLLAASMSLLAYVYVGRSYHKQYESTSTFIVSSKGSNNSVYSDLSTTTEMATKFSEILNSSILQKKVAKEMNMDYFPGTASAEVVNETNLLVLKVQADSPEMAFSLNKAIMNNYSVVTNRLIGTVVLDVLQNPTVPSGPVNEFQPAALMKKTFVMTKWLLQCVSHAPEQSMGQDYTILIRMVIKHIILRVFIYLIHSFYFIKELLPHVSSTITLHNLFFLESHSRFVTINTQKLSLVHQLFS